MLERVFDHNQVMASAAAVAALEADCPWVKDDFRADLARLAGSTAAAARSYASDVRVLARLAAQVPRCPFDETGSSPWTSFRREVALARKMSDQAAGKLIRHALRLTAVLPRTLALLEQGVLTVPRADAFLTELDHVGDHLAALLDAELADKVALLPKWRIELETRQAALRLDPDVVAQRTADKNADRGVEFHPNTDDQAWISLTGPAVPLTRWYATLDGKARALKAAGDPRTLDALRFDLATSTYPCDTHTPADPTRPAVPAPRTAAHADPAPPGTQPIATTPGLRPAFVEAAPVDCRMSRPAQARITVPVETSLGLSNEPGWLDGYGWISAPTSRQLLLDAELRRVCVKAGTGELVDLAPSDLRPPPTPAGLRDSLLTMILADLECDDVGWREEPRHDPSDRLRDYVRLRDRFCDGPTGARVAAARADLDHDDPWPQGPTAAWNLAARGRRTHQHKHHGWTPLRTPTSTLWLSPAGQLVEVPRHTTAPPGIDHPDGAVLPDPDELHLLDQLQLTASDDSRPWLPSTERDRTPWTILEGSDPAPF